MKHLILLLAIFTIPAGALADAKFDKLINDCSNTLNTEPNIGWNEFIEKDWFKKHNCQEACPKAQSHECSQARPGGMSPSNPIICKALPKSEAIEKYQFCTQICHEEYVKTITEKCTNFLAGQRRR